MVQNVHLLLVYHSLLSCRDWDVIVSAVSINVAAHDESQRLELRTSGCCDHLVAANLGIRVQRIRSPNLGIMDQR